VTTARRPTLFAVLLVGAVLVAVVGTAAALLSIRDRNSDNNTDGLGFFDPVTWLPPAWEIELGGDPSGPGEAVSPQLPHVGELTADDIAALEKLGRDVAAAEATGQGRDGLDWYFPRNHPKVGAPDDPPSGEADRFCRDVTVLDVAAATLPLGGVKIAVRWRGICPFGPLKHDGEAGDQTSALNFLYATRVLSPDPRDQAAQRWGGWVPVHVLDVPGAAAAARKAGRTPSAWELEELVECSLGPVVARGEVVYAWQQLCQEALGAQVPLLAVEGFRDPQQQAALYQRAIRFYGASEARQRVSFSDGETCLSRHCAGEAIDIQPSPEVLAWLQEPVGCLDSDPGNTTTEGVDGEPAGSSGDSSGRSLEDNRQSCTGLIVTRAARYGFAFTVPSSPGHLDYLAGTTDIDGNWYGDCTPGPLAVVDQIQLIFTCRALEAGTSLAEAQQTGIDAIEVARCTSALNPSSVAHGGRFINGVNPITGHRDDRSGLFGLSAAIADNFVIGGAETRQQVWAGIDGAARLWVHERLWGRWGWDPFGCAAGDDGNGVQMLG
jgi:hypothetical protein